MKRTLMLKNQELLDFEIDLKSGEVRILDAPDADDAFLTSAGFGGPDREISVAKIIRGRRISSIRDDISQILDAFGARTITELVFRGHGLSFTDKLWYRAPGSAERWEDINFLDNDWDATYCTSILTRDYKSLASCSPDIPDLTTAGHLRKAWERTEDGIFLLKESNLENRADLLGALLSAELCKLLYGQDAYQPLNIVERCGKSLAASPLMIGRDEELVQSRRLFAMGGIGAQETQEFMGAITSQHYIDIISRAGVAEASAYAAKLFTYHHLALLNDFHAGNFGIIRNLETGVCRAALPFDYDHSFGFPPGEATIEFFCNNPTLAALFVAGSFSDLDSSWDWSWYDPRALNGFEDRIIETYSNLADFPPNFGELVARFFVLQRNYINEIASARI